MVRCFFYLECDNHDKVIKYLDGYVSDNLLAYKIDDVDGFIEISTDSLDEDDELWDMLEKYDLIEDVDKRLDDDFDDFDDFYNNDDV